MLSRKLFEAVRERDGHFCLMALPGCQGEGGVLHHRANRGAGGSKVLDHPANLSLCCWACNGNAENAPALVRFDLIERGLRVEKAATNVATLHRAIRTPVTYLDGERYYLLSATERVHVDEYEPLKEETP